jgi:hypothetical protein
MSDMFLIRHSFSKGDVLTVLLFNIASEYSIVRAKTNQDGLRLNGANQLLVYADGDNILGGRIHTVKKNRETY